MIKDKFCFVYVTVENFDKQKSTAELAIKDKLVACANIFQSLIPCLNERRNWKRNSFTFKNIS